MAGRLTMEARVELARGKAGGLGVERGKVLEDLPPPPPEDLRVTGGGPDDAPLLGGGFPCSEDEGAACFGGGVPWCGPLEEEEAAEPNDPVLEDREDPDFGEWPTLEGEAFVDAAAPALEAGPEAAEDLTGAAPTSAVSESGLCSAERCGDTEVVPTDFQC